MDKYNNVDFIQCFSKDIRDFIVAAFENTGYALVVSDKIDDKYYIQVIEKHKLRKNPMDMV